MASGSGWNLWMWRMWVEYMGVVARRYIDFLILLIPTPLVSVLFCSRIPTFCSVFKMVFVFVYHDLMYTRNIQDIFSNSSLNHISPHIFSLSFYPSVLPRSLHLSLCSLNPSLFLSHLLSIPPSLSRSLLLSLPPSLSPSLILSFRPSLPHSLHPSLSPPCLPLALPPSLYPSLSPSSLPPSLYPTFSLLLPLSLP